VRLSPFSGGNAIHWVTSGFVADVMFDVVGSVTCDMYAYNMTVIRCKLKAAINVCCSSDQKCPMSCLEPTDFVRVFSDTVQPSRLATIVH